MISTNLITIIILNLLNSLATAQQNDPTSISIPFVDITKIPTNTSMIQYCGNTTDNVIPCQNLQQDAILKQDNGAYRKGDNAIIFVRYIYDSTKRSEVDSLLVQSGNENETLAGVFVPLVDVYTQISIPGTGQHLYNDIRSVSTRNPRIVVDLLFHGKIYRSSMRYWSMQQNGNVYVVPSRTLLISLNRGEPKSVDWTVTNCVLATCTCIDQICGMICGSGGPCSDINIMVAWSGSDSAGNMLTSAREF